MDDTLPGDVQRVAGEYAYICRLLTDHPPSEPDDVDWQYFLVLADGHGVAPLLHYTLTSEDTLRFIPEHVQRALQHKYYSSTAQQALLFTELERIADVLPAPVILLKGAALASTLYPQPATRPLGDLDLLIPRSALDDAVAAVKSLGYNEFAPEIGAGMHEIASHHVHLRGGSDENLVVELHWTLASSDDTYYAPDLTWFWEQTEAWKPERSGAQEIERRAEREQEGMQGSGASMRQLTPTAHLLFLAAHLMLQHGARDARLLWFYDLHLLLTKCGDRIEWETLIEKAQAFHWAPALHAALRGVHARLDTPLPKEQMRLLVEITNRDPAAAALVKRQSITNPTQTMRVRSKLAGMSWPSRLRYVRNQLLPHPKYIHWRYDPEPAWIWPLYYPYRWLHILRDGVRTVTRMITQCRP